MNSLLTDMCNLIINDSMAIVLSSEVFSLIGPVNNLAFLECKKFIGLV